jgi:hypothetical protein
MAPGGHPGADIGQHHPGHGLARLQRHRGAIDTDRQRVLAAGACTEGSSSRTFEMYQKEFPAGQVSLGPDADTANRGSMDTIIVS